AQASAVAKDARNLTTHSIRPRDSNSFIVVCSGLVECCSRGAAQFGRYMLRGKIERGKNMKFIKYILLGVLTFLVGIAFVQNIHRHDAESVETENQKVQLDSPSKQSQPRFLYLGGTGSYGSFKSSGSEPRFADDCIGCGEIGDISIYHNIERKPEHTQYTLEAQCGKGNKNLVERSIKLNEQGQKIGERCLTIYPEGGAHIFWTEGVEYWFITTTSLEIAKEFESSEVFRLWKSGKYDALK
ncbi:MAG TPA: hypothetical protein VE732_04945, partial [Nitrososphaera sp.]|nr:hypothetical protein [Nitrososphaera sp.]